MYTFVQPVFQRKHARLKTLLSTSILQLILLAGCGGDGPSTGPNEVPEGDPIDLRIEWGGSPIAPGTSRQLAAIATYENGVALSVTDAVTWLTSDSAAMAISNSAGRNGMATRWTESSVELTATFESLSASMQICVWSTVLATGLRFDGDVSGRGTGYAIGHLAVDANAVYWAGFDQSAGDSGGFIGRVLKTGADATTLASGLGGINALASDGTHVYWTEFELPTGDGAIKRVSVTGGDVEVLSSGVPAGSLYGVFFPGGVVVDADFVYWGEHVGGGAIRRVPKAGGSVTDFARGEGFGPTALTLHDGFLYGVDNTSGAAARLPVVGGPVDLLASGLNNPIEVAVDASGLYSAELIGSSGRIVHIPVTGGALSSLSTGLDNPRSVAAQNGIVYFPGIFRSVQTTKLGLWKAAMGSSGEELIVDISGTVGGFQPSSLAVDEDFIFFVDAAWHAPGTARVLRAPRE